MEAAWKKVPNKLSRGGHFGVIFGDDFGPKSSPKLLKCSILAPMGQASRTKSVFWKPLANDLPKKGTFSPIWTGPACDPYTPAQSKRMSALSEEVGKMT